MRPAPRFCNTKSFLNKGASSGTSSRRTSSSSSQEHEWASHRPINSPENKRRKAIHLTNYKLCKDEDAGQCPYRTCWKDCSLDNGWTGFIPIANASASLLTLKRTTFLQIHIHRQAKKYQEHQASVLKSGTTTYRSGCLAHVASRTRVIVKRTSATCPGLLFSASNLFLQLLSASANIALKHGIHSLLQNLLWRSRVNDKW